MPSIHEGFGLVASEAARAGVVDDRLQLATVLPAGWTDRLQTCMTVPGTLGELRNVLGLSPSADEQRKLAALRQVMTVPA